jgi:uncharacterized protein (TIGR03382 family)
MKGKHILLGAIAGTLLTAGAANADFILGGAVIVPEDDSQVIIEFVGQDADFTGEFYFLGWGSVFEVTNPAPDTGTPGLGTLLFNNMSAAIGDTVMLPGSFDANAVLHFAYEVIAPDENTAVFATNVLADRNQFAYDADEGFFVIEDIPLPDSDYDWNDAQFQIAFQPIPTPGALALLGLAGLSARRRRRG